MFLIALTAMVLYRFCSEGLSGDSISTNDILFYLECDLLTIFRVVYTGWYLASLMNHIQQKCSGTIHAVFSIPLHLHLCLQSWTATLKKALQLPPSHLCPGPPQLVTSTHISVGKWLVLVLDHLSIRHKTACKYTFLSVYMLRCRLLQKSSRSVTFKSKWWWGIVHIQFCPPFSAALLC